MFLKMQEHNQKMKVTPTDCEVNNIARLIGCRNSQILTRCGEVYWRETWNYFNLSELLAGFDNNVFSQFR